jgi:HEAT repeat protein
VRSPEAVPRLLPLLGDKRKELRFAAVEALGAIRAAVAVLPLTGVLGDADRGLRRAAAESLGVIGDLQAVAPLLLALDDEHWSVRCAAATALGRIRSTKATPSLLGRLSDEDATVRRAAVAALGEIGDVRAAGHLAHLLPEAALQATALEALRRLGAGALTELERAFAAAEPAARCLLLDLVGKLEDPRARKLLLQALSDQSPVVRAAAALALGEGGFLDAVRPLMQVKEKDPSPEARQAAAGALRKLAPR